MKQYSYCLVKPAWDCTNYRYKTLFFAGSIDSDGDIQTFRWSGKSNDGLFFVDPDIAERVHRQISVISPEVRIVCVLLNEVLPF